MTDDDDGVLDVSYPMGDPEGDKVIAEIQQFPTGMPFGFATMVVRTSSGEDMVLIASQYEGGWCNQMYPLEDAHKLIESLQLNMKEFEEAGGHTGAN